MENQLFEAIILGSGTIVPSLKRSACSVLIKIGPFRLLFDTGPGTMRRLLRADTTIFDVACICYSHFHPDHVSELIPFLFGTKYPDASLQKHTLKLIGGKGFTEFYDGLNSVFGDWMTLEAQWVELIEANGTPNRITAVNPFDHFELQTTTMRHRPESLAYRIQLPDGRSMVYSGDTDYCENLIALSQQTDLLICECSMPDDMKAAGHLTPSLAGTIASEARAGKLVLTHLYPQCDQVDLIAQAGRTYAGPITVAEDLMQIEI